MNSFVQTSWDQMRPPADKAQTKAAIGCGETKYWELLKKGEFKNAFRVGNRWRVPWGDIEAYMERHRYPGDAA